MISDERLERLDRQLKEMAERNFEEFVQLTGLDRTQAFVCIQRGKGQSLAMIARMVGVSKQAISKRCKRCGGGR